MLYTSVKQVYFGFKKIGFYVYKRFHHHRRFVRVEVFLIKDMYTSPSATHSPVLEGKNLTFAYLKLKFGDNPRITPRDSKEETMRSPLTQSQCCRYP